MKKTLNSGTNYSPGNRFDRATAGLSRVTVATDLGDIIAHVDLNVAAESDSATLLLHGAAGSWTTWLPLIRASSAAQKPLQNIVALDLPGWGESGSLPASATVEELADAVVHVTKVLGFSQWTIFGHSLGGHLALTIAARYPERTAYVTAISTTGPGALAALRRPLRHFRSLPFLIGMLGAMRFLSTLGWAGPALVKTLHRCTLLGPLSSPLFAERRKIDGSVIASLAKEVRPTAFVRAAKAARKYDETQWSTIACPVTLVRGDKDVFVSSADDAWFAVTIPHANQHVSPHAGHFAHIESLTSRYSISQDHSRGDHVEPTTGLGVVRYSLSAGIAPDAPHPITDRC